MMYYFYTSRLCMCVCMSSGVDSRDVVIETAVLRPEFCGLGIGLGLEGSVLTVFKANQ